MSRPSLSIVPCPAYAPDDPTPRHERGCGRCGHRVHDLSAMDELQAQRLLDTPSERLCVHARVQRDGALVLREGRRSRRLRLQHAAERSMGLAMGLAMGLTAMAACAPHVRDVELDLPGSLCEDVNGYEIPCESEIDAWLRTIPESPPSAMTEHASETSEPEGTIEPETDDPEVVLEPERDEYDLLGFVDNAYDEPPSEAEVQAERERRLELERRARAAAGA